jgi:hypothetical protein
MWFIYQICLQHFLWSLKFWCFHILCTFSNVMKSVKTGQVWNSILLQRFCYVTYESLTMLYMNSATWTKYVVWNVQPRQYKTFVPVLLTFTVNVWGKLSLLYVLGGGPRDTSWNKEKRLHFIMSARHCHGSGN